MGKCCIQVWCGRLCEESPYAGGTTSIQTDQLPQALDNSRVAPHAFSMENNYKLDRRDFLTTATAAVIGSLISGMVPSGVRAAEASGVSESALPLPDRILGTVGTVRTRASDTLVELARTHDLGFTEIAAANPGVDVWLPGEGSEVTIPSAHLIPVADRFLKGIVVNLGQMRLYYRNPASGPDGDIMSFPIGIGREGWHTPTGTTRITAKRANPVWIPPESLRKENPDLPNAIGPGPMNPLGLFALNLGWENYVIHGTNKPYGVGRSVSHGCIRLYPEDIKKLFAAVTTGMTVTVMDRPVIVGRIDGKVILEAHPGHEDALRLQNGEAMHPLPPEEEGHGLSLVRLAAGKKPHSIDWALTRRVLRERRGIPVRLTQY